MTSHDQKSSNIAQRRTEPKQKKTVTRIHAVSMISAWILHFIARIKAQIHPHLITKPGWDPTIGDPSSRSHARSHAEP